MTATKADDAAAFLAAQRAADAILGDGFPAHLVPRDWEEVTATQLSTMRLLGPIGGWKVGAHDREAVPIASPLPLAGIVESPAAVASRFRGAECEISFRMARALPARPERYEEAEIVAAIGSCQATIEIISARFNNHPALDKFSLAADLGAHHGLCVGAPAASWSAEMFAGLSVAFIIDGVTRREATGSNPGGTDLARLLVWLANCAVVRAAGGIATGAVITTGSWTGLTFVEPGARVTAQFSGFPPATVEFQ